MQWNIQNYLQQKFDACILFVFGLAKKVTSPLPSNDILNEREDHFFFKKKKHQAFWKKFSSPVMYKLIHGKVVTWLAL